MFRRRWFSSPKTERRYFFSTNQGSCDIYADGVYVGRYTGTGITEFTYSTSRNYINISLVGISLPDQVYNYTNGIITDSLAIYQGSTTDAKYTAIFDAEIYETIPVTNARVQSTMTDIVMNYKLGDFVSTSKKELINSGIQVYPGYDGFYRLKEMHHNTMFVEFQEMQHAYRMLMDYVIYMLHNNLNISKLNQCLERCLR